MRVIIVILLFLYSGLYARTTFTFNYFVDKFKLTLPEITEKHLDQTGFITDPDSIVFLYVNDSRKIQSEIRYHDTSAFKIKKEVRDYLYKDDTTVINGISIDFRTGDTVNFYTEHLMSNGFKSLIYSYNRKCGKGYKISYEESGPLMVNQNYRTRCSDNNDQWKGYKTKVDKFDGFIETRDYDIVTNNRRKKYNRRFYLTSFDSAFAQCFYYPETKKESLIRLIKYKNKLRRYEYSFSSTDSGKDLYQITYYRYSRNGIISRKYFFNVKYNKNNLPTPVLDMIVDYHYDSKGRLCKQTSKKKGK